MKLHSPFTIRTGHEFERAVWDTFRQQYEKNPVYREFCEHLGRSPKQVDRMENIPFLPIQFFKEKVVYHGEGEPELVFSSSGTTGNQPSRHFVGDASCYRTSFTEGFRRFYGSPSDYCILALLPAYLERQGSSLVYMADALIHESAHPDSGFYLDDLQTLASKLKKLEQAGQKTLLIGVSFALLDLAEAYPMVLEHTLVMETGGMKGRRKELVREELHQLLKKGLGVDKVHSEYGMTELLSQAYSSGKGLFTCPPWMKVLARDPEDPLQPQPYGRNGGLNIIDLANRDSCAFIATQDLGRVYEDGSFEVLGRFDQADIRGCNLMVL